MFTVVRMKDAIPIPASELDKPRQLAVANQIEEKYCNRVIIDVGLCICLFEICDLGDSLMYQSDSAVHVSTTWGTGQGSVCGHGQVCSDEMCRSRGKQRGQRDRRVLTKGGNASVIGFTMLTSCR